MLARGMMLTSPIELHEVLNWNSKVGIGVLPQEIDIPVICGWQIPVTAPYLNGA